MSDDPKKYPVREWTALASPARGGARLLRLCAAAAAPPALRVAPAAGLRCALRVCDAHIAGAADGRQHFVQGRDAGGLVGGWAGGEKELKDWAAVPFSPIDPALRKAMTNFSEKKEAAVRRTACHSPAARTHGSLVRTTG